MSEPLNAIFDDIMAIPIREVDLDTGVVKPADPEEVRDAALGVIVRAWSAAEGQARSRVQPDLATVIGQGIHDLTTSIVHKAKTPGELDAECLVFGVAIAERVGSPAALPDTEVTE